MDRGLKAIKLPRGVTSAATAEVIKAIDRVQLTGKHRAIEIGKPYLDRHHDQTAFSITDFPEIEALIRTAHAGFEQAEPPWDRINVIGRSYQKGGTRTPHVDRPDVFGEDVYTCILLNTSDERFTFHAPEKKKWGDSAVTYRVPESPGLCVHLTGPASTNWKHEVPRLKSGHRLSVSWRFYRTNDGEDLPPPPLKQPRFGPDRQNKVGRLQSVRRNRCRTVGGKPTMAERGQSPLGAKRLGISGEKSGLILDISAFLRSLYAVHRQLGRRSAVYVLWENVTGNTEDNAKYIAKSTGTKTPIELNAGVVSFATRPRLWWLTWILTLSLPESWGKGEPWPVLKTGENHRLEHRGITPTTRPSDRKSRAEWCRLPRRQARFQVRRWEGDNKRLATYHYRADNLLWNHNKTAWRMPSPDEGDVLLGYPRGCTNAPGILD